MGHKIAGTIVGTVTVAYFVVAGAFAYDRDWPWALVYFGYAIANIGLMLAAAAKLAGRL
jgi:hypothetical protein